MSGRLLGGYGFGGAKILPKISRDNTTVADDSVGSIVMAQVRQLVLLPGPI
jgi:hypothetical protein